MSTAVEMVQSHPCNSAIDLCLTSSRGTALDVNSVHRHEHHWTKMMSMDETVLLADRVDLPES